MYTAFREKSILKGGIGLYRKYSELRDKREMNDHSVAVATGIPQSTIYDWKQRSANDPKAKLSVDNLAKIAVLFGVPIETFLG